MALHLHQFYLFFFFLLFHQLLSSTTVAETVRYLPGLEGPLPFHLETGYVAVDETNEVQLFYYFVKSERNPKEDPLVLWLTGGPRCSAVSAFAFEIGPIYFKVQEYNGSLPTLVLNPHSWTKVANIIFLDEPVGSGFSYSGNDQGINITDTKSAMDSYQFLRKWLIDHPEFMSNPLYVCGDSYSGMIIPILVQELLNGIEAGKKPLLNFKGYLIGNPVTDKDLEENAEIPFAHGMGLISDELYESLKQNCEGDYTKNDTRNVDCSNDLNAFEKCVSRINKVQILEPLCKFEFRKSTDKHRRTLGSHIENFLPEAIPPTMCRDHGYLLSYYWANNDRVRKALHIREGTIKEWIRCNDDLPYQSDIGRSIEYHRNLSTRGYRSLIYSGDHDMWVSHLSTETWIRLLNLSIVDDWHPWLVEGQIGGYTRTFSNGMTYATVKGGGHTAPEYRPRECLSMFESWISHNPL